MGYVQLHTLDSENWALLEVHGYLRECVPSRHHPDNSGSIRLFARASLFWTNWHRRHCGLPCSPFLLSFSAVSGQGVLLLRSAHSLRRAARARALTRLIKRVSAAIGWPDETKRVQWVFVARERTGRVRGSIRGRCVVRSALFSFVWYVTCKRLACPNKPLVGRCCGLSQWLLLPRIAGRHRGGDQAPVRGIARDCGWRSEEKSWQFLHPECCWCLFFLRNQYWARVVQHQGLLMRNSYYLCANIRTKLAKLDYMFNMTFVCDGLRKRLRKRYVVFAMVSLIFYLSFGHVRR